MAAIHCVLALLKAGDHVIASNDLYGGTYRLCRTFFEKFGIAVLASSTRATSRRRRGRVPQGDPPVMLETPTNPLLRLCDIEAIGKLAKKGGALVMADNTFATPYLQNPLAARRRHRHPLDDEVPRRPFGRRRRRPRRRRRRAPRAARALPEHLRRHAGSARLLPRAARHEDAARAHGAPLRERARDRELPRAAPRVERVIYYRRCLPTRSTSSRSARCATAAA
jgi:hypothetical protein